MSEFQEVMRQWTRICNDVPGKSDSGGICTDKRSGYICPLHRSGLCNKSVSKQTDNDRLEGEKIIMAWAAEHPEPVYPTWGVWLMEYFTGRPEKVDIPYLTGMIVSSCIPADIAQKLGIEPKEG